METNRKRIEIDISGTKFFVSQDILTNKPYTRLGRMASKLSKDRNEESTVSFQFDRPIPSFQTVLEYYQTEQLHMPVNTCPKSFQKELEFWEIDPGEMEKCCLYQYITFMDDFETLYNFQTSLQKEQEQTDTRLKSKKSSFKHKRARLWAILDNKESSLLAKHVREEKLNINQ
ncbi:hypothetical protein KUTeg_020648 [Tegillarca granosa]|uniref:BTB domain-containing protein n=1 Tax=Tegillarca granosa TaxID=220873 RepID=A0ABQ9ECV6_TEGGR|nr:hypothetical protein KUTeg_020648 [Tegillarca granosa]